MLEWKICDMTFGHRKQRGTKSSIYGLSRSPADGRRISSSRGGQRLLSVLSHSLDFKPRFRNVAWCLGCRRQGSQNVPPVGDLRLERMIHDAPLDFRPMDRVATRQRQGSLVTHMSKKSVTEAINLIWVVLIEQYLVRQRPLDVPLVVRESTPTLPPPDR